MKARFEFEIPEDNDDFRIHCEASAMHCLLFSFGEFLRRRYKHTDCTDEVRKEYEEIKERFYEMLKEYDIRTLE